MCRFPYDTPCREMTAEWQADYVAWQKRQLSARRYVYVWADGSVPDGRSRRMHAGADMSKPGGQEGTRRIPDRVRESAQSWRELLVAGHQAPALLGSQDRQR